VTSPEITVCIAAWDEVETLGAVVHEIRAVLERLDATHDILIIDDGSTDGTSEAADRLAGSLEGVRVIHHGENLGLGFVYRTGFREAKGDFLSFFPADGQFPAAILEQFHPLAKDHDIVLGYLPQRRGSLAGAALSRAERLLYRILFGKMPRLEGVFMLRRSILAEIPLRSRGRGWAVVMELVIRASRGGYRIVGAPTDMRPRAAGRSKVNNLRHILVNFEQLLRLRMLL
jgi:glycosyltransferase involved in cell wall biosynthesis